MSTFNTPPPKKPSSSRLPSKSPRDPEVRNLNTLPPKQSLSTAIRDPDAGQSVILFNKQFKRDTCACGKDSCKDLTKRYKSIYDLRGHYYQIPTITPGLTQPKRLEKLNRKLERIKTHLNLGPGFLGSIDNRSQKSYQPVETRGKKKKTTRQLKYISLHHFDPIILREFGSNIDTVPINFIQNHALWHNGYTEGDLNATKDKFYFVPSYKPDFALSDLVNIEQQQLLHDLLTEVVSVRRGGYTYRADASGTKRQKLSLDNNDDLQRLVCRLHEQLEQSKSGKHQSDAESDATLNTQSIESIEKWMKRKNGVLTRITITSDEFHRNNPIIGKELFCFEDPTEEGTLSSWDITKQFIDDCFGIQPKEHTVQSVNEPNGSPSQLDSFEQCLIALMWFENQYPRVLLASIFGVGLNVIGRVLSAWSPLFGQLGRDLGQLDLTKEFLDEAYPQSYKDLNFRQPVASVVDGTDVHTQTSRIDRAASICQSSSKTGGSAVRGITWSTPMGMVHEFTIPFFARGSEKSLFYIWAKYGRLRDIPIGYLMSGGKGFDKTSGSYYHFVPIIHPAFLTKGAQFTEEANDWNRRACEPRYTSEVVFARVKKRGGLSGIIDRHTFPYLSDLWCWAHGRANFYQPLQPPADDDYFPKSKYKKN